MKAEEEFSHPVVEYCSGAFELFALRNAKQRTLQFSENVSSVMVSYVDLRNVPPALCAET